MDERAPGRESVPDEVPTRPVPVQREVSAALDELQRDPVLRGCRFVKYDGAKRPALGPEGEPWIIMKRLPPGGMGVVYIAVDPDLKAKVAIKVLPQEREFNEPKLAERFLLEARIGGQLDKTHLVRVIKFGRDTRTKALYFVMEFVDGRTARSWVRDQPGGRASERDALDVCIAATHGLRAVHEACVESAPKGAVHRDVKPDNIFIPYGSGGRLDLTAAKLGDLGLSHPEDASHELTGDAHAMGTPGYAPPEQIERGREVLKSADVFAMGATLYALLTGAAPFEGGDSRARIEATRKGRHRRLRDVRPDVSEATDDLVRKCLQADPAERFADAAALLKALTECRRRQSRSGASGDPGLTRDLPSTRELMSRIVVRGGPPNASFSVRRQSDGATVSDSSLDAAGAATLQVTPGAYRILVSEPRHDEFQSVVAVSAGADAEIQVEPHLREGFLHVESDPAGAEVLVGSRLAGETPLRRHALPAGRHAVVVRCAGYVDASFDVDVEAAATCRVGLVSLEPMPVLDAPGLPSDAVLELDGRRASDRDLVAPGVHTLEAKRRGFETQRFVLTFRAGAHVRPDFSPWRREAIVLLDDLAAWDAAVPGEREAAVRAVERELRGFASCGSEWFEAGGQRHEISCFRHDATGIEFALVPGGRATLGSERDEAGRRPDERRRTWTIKPFLCARTPVSRRSWRTLMPQTPGTARSDDLPATGISWDEASEFCSRAGFELPTEWQREYAARAGTTTTFAFGDARELAGRFAWWRENSGLTPHPSGGLAPNAFGLFDVHGNTADWCSNEYREDPDAPDAGAESGARRACRAFRGGTCLDDLRHLRSAARSAFAGSLRSFPVGVRPIVRIAPAALRPVAAPLVSPPPPPAPSALASAPSAAPPPDGGPPADVAEPPAASLVTGASSLGLPPQVRTSARWAAATTDERRRAAGALAAYLSVFAFRGLHTFESGPVRHEVAVFLHAATGLEFSLVPGAEFAPFLVARTPVTVRVWRDVMGADAAPAAGPHHPAEHVSFEDAVEFCARTGLSVPDEVQWEAACRAGATTSFSFGDGERDLDRHAWYDANSGGRTHPVGEKAPNALGLFDVHGNVWEWCRDPGGAAEGGAQAAAEGTIRFVRGGGAAATAQQLRCTSRLPVPPGRKLATVGLRPCFPLGAGESVGA